MEENDYSLLRDFDPEAAKRGEPIVWTPFTDCVFLGESINMPNSPELGPQYCIEHSGGLSYAPACDLRMKPLTWVESRPVYKGDVLWHKIGNYFVTVEHPGDADYFTCEKGTFEYRYLTWTPPKVKREGFVCLVKRAMRPASGEAHLELTDVIVRNGMIFATHEDAQAWADQCGDVIAIAPVPWEEPAGQEGGAA